MSELETERRDQVAHLTLNRPESLNALTPALRDRLIDLLAQASADPDVRAVVLTGRGRGFCAGADLRGGTGSGSGAGSGAGAGAGSAAGSGSGAGSDSGSGSGAGSSSGAGSAAGSDSGSGSGAGSAAGSDSGPGSGSGSDSGPGPGARLPGDVARMLRQGAQRLIGAVLDCEKPVIAAVNGTAAGLGAHLAFACDLVLAAESARFVEVFVRRGLVPDAGGAYLLPRLLGPHRAKELMFFGDAVPAADAARLGLVNRVVPDGELEKTAREWATRLAAAPTRALALTKQLVNTSLESDRATAFAAEAWAQELNMTTEDAQEGLRAFAERRGAVFRGR
ncbi:enoyl-CoA hydratase/isomerase-like protein [Streptomyces puniciscabiei]|uniref:Enoyl-CoA hydratase/isomerase-like protein n=2 Tax=Streptomyces puniciscabiei TaxID=164348 RepID=A0A542UGV4_9ACTN|nr:enoyl-CoA hydratase-related protein [Streptomyces puniciscabiei]TQK98291.1 enoyl-CoA hydratase/isomerase-like protein [Streptomyces puniciscabiei]